MDNWWIPVLVSSSVLGLGTPVGLKRKRRINQAKATAHQGQARGNGWENLVPRRGWGGGGRRPESRVGSDSVP